MKRMISRIFALAVATVLLLSFSLCAAAAPMPSAEEIKMITDLGGTNFDMESAAGSGTSSEYDGTPLFLLVAVDENDNVQLGLNAFLVYDSNSNANYLLTTYVVETLMEEGYSFILFGENGYAEDVKLLGTFARVACLDAPGLRNATCFELSAGVPDEITIMFRGVEDGDVSEPLSESYRLSSGWIQEGDLFIYDGEYETTFMLGAPVFAGDKGTLVGVGMTDGDGHLVVGSLAGNTLPTKYAIQTFESKTSETKPQDTAPGKSKPTDSGSGGISGILGDMDPKTVGFCAAIAAVLVVVFLKNRAGNKKTKKRDYDPLVGAEIPQPVVQQPIVQQPVVQQPVAQQPIVPEVIQATVPLQEAPEGLSTVMPQPNWRLRGLSGPLAGETFLINGMALVGRNPQCDISFPGSTAGISGRHCQLIVTEEKAAICDVGSSYGTFLKNGVRLQPNQKYFIRPGEVIHLGNPNGPSFILEKRV